MSTGEPSADAFSVKITGRPRIVVGGAPEPPPCVPRLPIQTGEPPVPTASAIVANWGKVSMFAIHTALPREVGSIRAYILAMFSHRIVALAWPASFATFTLAGQLMKPS